MQSSADHRLETRARDRDRGAGSEELLVRDPGGRHHETAAPLDEQDRRAVERQQAAQLLDEGRERHVEVERGAERAGGAARGLAEVDASAELVAEPLGLRGTLLGGARLAALELDEASDDRHRARARSALEARSSRLCAG